MKKKNIYILIGIIIVAVLMYINWITMHYSADTYNIINVGYEKYATNWSLKDGRLFMYIITMISAKINMPISIFVMGTLIVAIIISAVAVLKLKNILIKDINNITLKKEILFTILSFFTIFNFMYIEDMYFVESIVMAISLLLFIYASEFIVYANKQKKKFWLGLVFAILGVIAYQGTIGFLIILTFVLSLLKNKVELKGKKEELKNNIKQILWDLLKSLTVVVIAIGVNMIIVSIIGKITGLEQTRVGSITSIFSNLGYILNNFEKILKDCIGLFPNYALYIFLAVLLTFSIIYDIKTKDKNFFTIKTILIILISLIGAFIVSVGTLSSFYTGRLRFCIGSMIGFILICLIKENDEKLCNYFLYFILIIYSILNIYNCIIVTYEHKLVNIYEKEEVQNINNYIKEYEDKTSINVNKIAIYTVKGQSNKAYFTNINRKSVVTYNSLRCEWTADGLINYYSEDKLERITLTKELLIEYLQNKPSKGYKIINDTLVLECYMY